MNTSTLRDHGFAEYSEVDGRFHMNDIESFMDKGLESYPNNLMHMFGSYTNDFEIPDDSTFRGRKINFIFALKHINNGLINSNKWML